MKAHGESIEGDHGEDPGKVPPISEEARALTDHAVIPTVRGGREGGDPHRLLVPGGMAPQPVPRPDGDGRREAGSRVRLGRPIGPEDQEGDREPRAPEAGMKEGGPSSKRRTCRSAK